MTTVLYVDDEESIGKVVSRFLERRGDRVYVAMTVAQAQAAIEEEDPAIIFLDMWLGSESGFELMNWIDDHKPHLAEVVTFVTGAMFDPDSEEMACKTLGRPIIRKPFDLVQIVEAVDDAERRVRT